jgi:hypothetical protein
MSLGQLEPDSICGSALGIERSPLAPREKPPRAMDEKEKAGRFELLSSDPRPAKC